MQNEVTTPFDVGDIRQQFPVLDQEVNGKGLVYFDNAATTQKPNSVLKAITEYYTQDNANIHRGIHQLAERATAAYEETRKTLAAFINAPSPEEVIFTKGTTDAINLVANSFGRWAIEKGDEVIITTMEHHSNIVPWQMICEERGATLKVIPISDEGVLDLYAFAQLLSSNTKLVSVVYVSNTLGTINPVQQIIELAHDVGAKVLLDGAQSTSHFEIDVQALDVDFYALSAHKIYGPTGVGALYGKKELLESIPPYQGGGEMIKEVSFEKTTFADLPHKFEAGTPNIAGVIAFKKALEFVQSVGFDNIALHEDALLVHGTDVVSTIPGLRIVGTSPDKASVISFVVDGVHHQDIGIMMDTHGFALRTGHHCTQPLMNRFGILGTSRASFAIYNTLDEITRMGEALEKVIKLLK